jgi:intracellular sulfur oxidation DsrE/DsrF family protein
MRLAIGLTVAAFGLLFAAPVLAAGPPDSNGLVITVPVKLKEAKVVFNLDHLAFEGDEPTGLQFLRVMTRRFESDGTKAEIVAIFHGAAGYMALDDATYDRVRNWRQGNPYKHQIETLMHEGVDVEICGETMAANHWINADLLPGMKVNTGANFRIIQLVQEGFVQLQP